MLLEVSLMKFILLDIQRDQMEGESGVTRSIINELHSWDIQGDQIEAESMVLLKEPWMKFILRVS